MGYIYLLHGLFIFYYMHYTMLSLINNFVLLKDSLFSKEKTVPA